MPADQDFLERLDAAIGCMHCQRPLPENAVSDYFCGQRCAEAYADQRAPRRGGFDYFEDIDDDEPGWGPDDLTDLEPVSWIRPPEFRLPRSTGDLEADQQALIRACETVTTTAQQAACDLRQDDLDARQRAVWAREWRLPRSSDDIGYDRADLREAERTATTDHQRAACALRRESLRERHLRRSANATPGDLTSWGIDGFTFRAPLPDLDPTSPTYVYGPYGTGPTSWGYLTSSPIVHSRISWPEADEDPNPASFGSRVENNLPGIQPSTMRLHGVYESANNRVELTITPPRMLTYELRRDSDETLLIVQAVPEDMRFSWSLPDWVDCTGCSVRVLHEGREIGRYPYVDTRTRRPAPALDRGDTVSITTSDGTRSYTVEGVAPDGSLTCRRITEDEPPPTGGA